MHLHNSRDSCQWKSQLQKTARVGSTEHSRKDSKIVEIFKFYSKFLVISYCLLGAFTANKIYFVFHNFHITTNNFWTNMISHTLLAFHSLHVQNVQQCSLAQYYLSLSYMSKCFKRGITQAKLITKQAKLYSFSTYLHILISIINQQFSIFYKRKEQAYIETYIHSNSYCDL